MYRYTAGKQDWFANNLPLEGARAHTPRAGDRARHDVPTCGLGDRVGEVQERTRAAGWRLCVVVNDAGVVLGLLEGDALEGDPRATAAQAMAPGPDTIRPNVEAREMARRMRDEHLERILVTTSGGQLVGLLQRDDVEPLLRAPARTLQIEPSRGHESPRLVEIGYSLSSEEHPPRDLVRYARHAEEAGFTFALISDHYHPWTDRQGQSPFVWNVIGGIAHATRQLRLGTGVTCPLMRTHPAIVAQAAATAAAAMPGRFFLGVGTGERLNEHILGDHWPPAPVRLEMLEEAVEVIRLLWQGDVQSHRGQYYTVEQARLYTLPDEPPPLLVAASGARMAKLAGRIGDGLIGVGAAPKVRAQFEAAGGAGKPCYGQLHVCWAPTDAEARRTAHEWWPTAALPGELNAELALPRQFEQAAQLVREEDVARAIVCSADPGRHLQAIKELVDAGYDHVYVHQVGPDQEGFFRFYEQHVLPRLG